MSLVAAGAIGVGAALALAMPAGAAVITQSPPAATVKLGGTATLDANGAVVFAPVSVFCRPGSTAYLTVQVTEAVGNDIASGSVDQTIDPCANQQNLRVAVTPSQHPFRKGVAFGQASVTSCGSTGCKTAKDEKVIQIVNR